MYHFFLSFHKLVQNREHSTVQHAQHTHTYQAQGLDSKCSAHLSQMAVHNQWSSRTAGFMELLRHNPDGILLMWVELCEASTGRIGNCVKLLDERVERMVNNMSTLVLVHVGRCLIVTSKKLRAHKSLEVSLIQGNHKHCGHSQRYAQQLNSKLVHSPCIAVVWVHRQLWKHVN